MDHASDPPAVADAATAPYGPALSRVDRLIGPPAGFGVALGLAAALGIGANVVGYLSLDSEIKLQRDRNDFLGAQIAEVDRDLKELLELDRVRSGLIARLRVVEQLGRGGSAPAASPLADLGNKLPGGLVLTRIRGSGSEFEIHGVARDVSRLTAYVAALQGCAPFDVTSVSDVPGGIAFVASGRLLRDCHREGGSR